MKRKTHIQAYDLLGRGRHLLLKDGSTIWFKAMAFDGGTFSGYDQESFVIRIEKEEIESVVSKGQTFMFLAAN